MVGVARELLAGGSAGVHGIGDHYPDVREQPRRERAHQCRHGLAQDGRARIAEQQVEAIVGIHDGDRGAGGGERQGMEMHGSGTQGAQRGAGVQTQSGRVTADVCAGRRSRYADIEQRPCFGAPDACHRSCPREDAAIFRGEIRIEQAALEEAGRRVERRGYEHGVHVVGKTPTSQSRIAVAPLPHRETRLERNQVSRLRIRREGRRSPHQEPEVLDQIRAENLRCLARAAIHLSQGSRRERSPSVIVKQPGRGNWRQHEAAVDHLVIEDRRTRAGAARVQMLENRELSDIFLVRHFSVR